MATEATYYLDTASFTNATAVFSDSTLSTCAPDGFYANGTIVREQVSCVLLPAQACPSCPTPTPAPVPVPSVPVPVPVPSVPVPVPSVPSPVPAPAPVPVPIPPSYIYYFASPCGGGATVYFRSVSVYAVGESVKINGLGDTCYEVGGNGAPLNNNDVTVAYIDCSACVPVPVPAPVPVPVPVPAPPVAYEYKFDINEQQGSATKEAACGNLLSVSVYSTNNTLLSALQLGELWYDSPSLSSGFNGDFLWYGAGNTSDLDSIYSVLLSSAGAVQINGLYDCSTPTPAPAPVPVPVPNTPIPSPVPVPSVPTPVPSVPTPVPSVPTPVPSVPVPVPSVPVPVPAPPDNVFGVERLADGFSTYVQIAQGYNINDQVEISSDPGQCYEIMFLDYVVNPGIYGTITGGCTPVPVPAPAPAPAPVPSVPTPSPPTVYTKLITAEEDGGYGNETTPAATAKTELCFDFMSFNAYSEANNIATAIQVGQVWYADAAATNPFSGAFKWYGVGPTNSFGAEYVIRLSDAGVVTETNTVC